MMMHANDTMSDERSDAMRQRFTADIHRLWHRWIGRLLSCNLPSCLLYPRYTDFLALSLVIVPATDYLFPTLMSVFPNPPHTRLSKFRSQSSPHACAVVKYRNSALYA